MWNLKIFSQRQHIWELYHKTDLEGCVSERERSSSLEKGDEFTNAGHSVEIKSIRNIINNVIKKQSLIIFF